MRAATATSGSVPDVGTRPRLATLTAAVVSALVIVDAATTWWWLHIGVAIEGNPAVAAIIEVHGAGVGLTLRTALTVALTVWLWLLADRSRWAAVGLAGCAAAYLAVIGVHLAGWVSL
jgi:hypothetical protein